MLGNVAPTPFDLRFSLFGIPVRVHPFFWLFSVIMGWDPRNPNRVLIWVACVFVSILVHELGHALTARSYGWPPHIVLHTFGGYASFQPTHGYTTGRAILILLAGPGAGFILFGAICGLELFLEHRQIVPSRMAQLALADMEWINLACGLV